MATCPNCGKGNPEGFRYCGFCSSALPEPGAAPEERKVVSVLFCDLAGFTARSDRADPEDVRATTRSYHQRAKREIERLGGTVEKFVGDAVMAVFGAPIAHEDDAERAVRAALRITDSIDELNEQQPGLDLGVRVAVDTGEALVTLTARPELGEGLVAGDVVNTASRLQQLAPVGGVVVGEGTYRSTRDHIEYEELAPVKVKGKVEAARVWRGIAPRSDAEVAEAARSLFVGRESELRLLTDTFLRALAEPSVQLVTVVGEPGVGKSRLVSEFATFVESQPDPVFWRQGRCLPYGDGLTFWALGEVVKAHAGILEFDGAEEASAKLATAVEVVEDPSEREWMRAKLGALVGLAPGAAGVSDRGELFTAWRRFIEAIATDRPLVLVLEDLHWADPLMLEFVARLTEWSAELPIVVLGTMRPELFETHPGWPGVVGNVSTLRLLPLTDGETERLISALLGGAVLPISVQAELLERCGGNPLYARQFARMLEDLRVPNDERRPALGSEGEIPVPETIRALIAARLDSLSRLHKSLLQDAAVVGKVYWPGALASMQSIPEGEAEWRLHELTRKELARLAQGSSIAGQAEYAFPHILIRDVAYRQIPRTDRVRKHRAVAEWIEASAGERIMDHAEIVAHHYTEALRLAGASGMTEEARALVGPAVRFLIMAGDGTIQLDVNRADGYYRRALNLLPPGDPVLGGLHAKLARAAELAGRIGEAEEFYKQAIQEDREQRDGLGAGEALVGLADLVWGEGSTGETGALLAEAIDLLEVEPAGYGLTLAYLLMSRQCWRPGRPEECLAWSEKGLALAEQLKIDELIVRGRGYRALAWIGLGDPLKALQEGRDCLKLGASLGVGQETARVYNNLSLWVWGEEGPSTALEILREGVEFAERRGLVGMAMSLRSTSLGMLYDIGAWDELLADADTAISWARDQAPPLALEALSRKAWVLARRGLAAIATRLKEEFMPLARTTRDVGQSVLAIGALIDQAAGDVPSAVRFIEELRDTTQDDPYERLGRLPIAVSVLAAARATESAHAFLEGVEPRWALDRPFVVFAQSVLEETEGQVEQAAMHYADSADQWEGGGFVPYRADALLGGGRCLFALGKREEAIASLEEALRVFRHLGAQPSIDETESWLARARAS